MAVTDPYQAKPDGYFGNTRPEMLSLVPASAMRVLDVGCGRGDFSAALKAVRDVHVTGLEPFPAAADVASKRLDAVLQTTVETGFEQLEARSFDCIVFNDVLEHLVEPGTVLQKARSLLRPGGAVVASIPNVRFFPVLKQLVLHGEWRYADDGVLDRTHLRFFTTKSMVTLFDDAGYVVRSMRGINPGHFTWKFELLLRISAGALDDTRHQQVAIVAAPR